MPNQYFKEFMCGLLIPILIGALQSVAIANIVVMLVDGPRMLENGGHVLSLLAWCAINVGVLFLIDLMDR